MIRSWHPGQRRGRHGEAERAGRRGTRRGGAARRAARSAVRFETARFIERNIPNFEILNEEALEIIEHNAETVLEEIGVEFRREPRRAGRWREAGADVDGRAGAHPRGLARKLCETAPSRFTQIARNPARNVEIGGKSSSSRAGLRPALRARPLDGGRRYATMADFETLRETGLHVEMAAPFRRHGLRTHRRAREQAPFRHALRAYDAFRQTLHGLGHRTLARAGFGGDVRRSSSARTSWTEHGDDLAHQHQLAADLRRRDDGRAGGLRRRGAGLHRLALHRRRRDGAGLGGGHADAGSGRGAGRRRLFAAGAAPARR
jgi:hypothetical protein